MNEPAEWGRPAFAKDFPKDDDLEALVVAFGAGDYKTVNEGAAKIASGDKPDDVKAAAKLLAARTAPDPTSRLLFLFTAVLLVFLSAWWMSHDGPPKDGSAAPSPPPTVEYPDRRR